MIGANRGKHRALSRPLDLVIANKFGKQEAVGSGLLKPTADAIGLGIPTLAGVSSLNHSACATFVGAIPTRLKPDCRYIEAWCELQIELRRSVWSS